MIRNQDENGNVITSGQHFIYDKEAVALGVVRRIKLFFGEYFLDRTDGTKMFTDILGKSSDVSRQQELRRRIITAPHVLDVVYMNIEMDRSRKISASVTIVTDLDDETVTINEVF